MLATLQLRNREYPISTEPPPAGRPLAAGEVFVKGGPFVMGTDTEPWAFDNERPAHSVDLPPFWIDTAPVSNRAFIEFIEDGGYGDGQWWSDEGWEHRIKDDIEHPQFWSRNAGAWSRSRFGQQEPVPMDEPVQHVCWYEAEAYANWAGKRLPTEAEWEKAASWDPGTGTKRRFPWGDSAPAPEHANLGQRHFHPAPIGAYPAGVSPAGCHQMIGDVWEWTSTDFDQHPGYVCFPYREYSEVFFGRSYKVLRGGSWATHPVAVRNTFRNWDFPIRRQIFCGFRCARDA
jgi:iron(II)-dependent oxidoreductase